MLALPDPATTLGLRDRAMLETLYATGIRRAELARLALGDVDGARLTLWIRRGKGDRDRVVPLGRRGFQWITRYCAERRTRLARPWSGDRLFLTWRGNPWHPKHLGERIRQYLHRSGLAGRGSCHLFRHTMATLMFEGGADIRHLQVILGHAKLTTTQIYTRVSIQGLCAVHARTHPGERDAWRNSGCLAPPDRASINVPVCTAHAP